MKITSGNSAQNRRQFASNLFFGILSIMIFSIATLVSTGFVMGVLRLRTRRFRTIAATRPASMGLADTSSKPFPHRVFESLSPLCPPWLVGDSSHKKKTFILSQVDDMYLYNGVPPPDAFMQSTENLFRDDAGIGDDAPMEIVHCANCVPADGYEWFAATTSGGLEMSALVKESANQSALVRFTGKSNSSKKWNSIDFGIPYGCQDAQQLHYFTKLLSEVIKDIKLRINVRLLITNHSCAHAAGRLTLEDVETSSGLKRRRSLKVKQNRTETDRVISIPVRGPFSETQARSVLHANTHQEDQHSLLIVLSVEFFSNIRLLHSAMAFVSVGVSAYFPVARLAYNPRSIKVAFAFRQISEQGVFHKDQGVWGKAGFDVYAMASPDAAKISMELDSAYKGWGVEGHDFIGEPILKHVHIIRKQESGLVRMWYPIKCQVDHMSRNCVRRMAHLEASPLSIFVRVNQQRFPQGKHTSQNGQIMIAVTTSRTTFSKRVAALEAAWAKKAELPMAVVLRYFVGQQSSFAKRTLMGADMKEGFMKKELALQAKVISKDNNRGQSFDKDEAITILHEVEDDNPLAKKRATLQAIAKEVASSSEINWIMVIDDDTYVHISGLQRLLAQYDKNRAVLLGPMRLDKNNRKSDWDMMGSAYCLGGPTYIMSQAMLKKVMSEQECIRKAEALRPNHLHISFWRATVTDMCNERAAMTSTSCQEDDASYQSSKIFQRYDNESQGIVDHHYFKDLVSLHPLGNSKAMFYALKKFGRRRSDNVDLLE